MKRRITSKQRREISVKTYPELKNKDEKFWKTYKRELTPSERNILVAFLYNKGLINEVPEPF